MNFVQSGEMLIPEENIPTMTLTQLQNLTNLGPENDILSHSITELQPDINMDILTGGIPEDSIPSFDAVSLELKRDESIPSLTRMFSEVLTPSAS